MDKSLDDIIVHVDYRGGRGSRNRRSGGIGPIRHRDGGVRSRRPVPYSRARDIAHQRDHGGLNEDTTLFLSNLNSGLYGDDIRGLFRRFGRVREGTVHYDRSGLSLGTGTVTFERRADAIEAMQQHDNVRLVGRPVMMEILLSAPPDSDSRGTGQNRRSFAGRGGRGLRGGRRERVGPTTNMRRRTVQEERDAGLWDAELDECVQERDAELDECVREREGRHNRGGRRGRGGPTTTRRTPTAEELDAELDAYVREREGFQEAVEEEVEVDDEVSVEEEEDEVEVEEGFEEEV